MAIAAIVLGIVAVLFLPIVFGPVAIVLAIVSKVQGDPRANLALGVSIGGMLLGFVLGVLVFSAMFSTM